MAPEAATPTPVPAREPMAHRAPRPPRRAPGAALSGFVPAPVLRLVADEVAEMVRLARRVAPGRGRMGIVGLALLAVVAVGGMAGAAEPPPANRSALDAWSGSAAPSTHAALPGAAAAPVAPSAPAANTPTLADDPAFQGPNLLDLGAKTLLVVALLFITLRVMRRVQGGSAAKPGELLAILETRALGPKTQLHLVAVGDRRLVIGQSPAGLVALGELDAAELPVAAPAASTVREPWAHRDALDDDPALEAAMAHELATGRRSRVEVSA